MKSCLKRVLLPSLLLLQLLSSGFAEEADLDRADRLLQSGNTKGAAKIYQLAADNDTTDPFVWFRLGYCRHQLGEFEAAIVAARRCAEFPDYRGTALYNVACALSVTGDPDGAKTAIDDAIDAGFLDFDLLHADPELEAVREKYELPTPPEHRFLELTARNRIVLPYHVIAPPGDAAEAKNLTGVVVFGPGDGKQRSCDWVISEVLGENAARPGMLIVVIAGPDRGWINHPAHHALEELLTTLMKEYSVEQRRFHFVGVREGGAPALTYSRMSRRYCRGVTTISSSASRSWDSDDVNSLKGLDVRLLGGALDTAVAEEYQRMKKELDEQSIPATIDVRPGEGVVPQSLREGAWLDLLDDSE